MTIVKYDASGLTRLINGLRSLDGEVNKATARSINRTLTTARKEITTSVRKDYNIKAGAFKKGMPIKKANYKNPVGVLSVEGGPGVPLIDYQAGPRISPGRVPSTRWTGTSPKKRATPLRGISAVINKARGRRRIDGAFTAKMPTTHTGVFRRIDGKKMGNSRKEAIKELYGPSAARILTGNRYTEDIETLVEETMSKNMQNETRNILRKLGK